MNDTRPIAFLSMASLQGFECYDALAAEALRRRGQAVVDVDWRRGDVDWAGFKAVVVRSTWDYQQDAAAFVRTLAAIDARTRLFNPLVLMRWNLDKRYLRELARRGVPIVPTQFVERFDVTRLQAARQAFGCDELVIKPAISANADHTYRLPVEGGPDAAFLQACFGQRPHLLQPFVHTVTDHGEVSLFHFGARLSHAIRKTPKPGDFRVQEEHGGQLRAIRPEPALCRAAEGVLRELPLAPLYARTDFVDIEGRWCLMEVELIEPSLYFNLDAQAAGRFADALLQALKATAVCRDRAASLCSPPSDLAGRTHEQ